LPTFLLEPSREATVGIATDDDVAARRAVIVNAFASEIKSSPFHRARMGGEKALVAFIEEPLQLRPLGDWEGGHAAPPFAMTSDDEQ